MPKKAKKTPKIAFLSDSDDEDDDFKNPKKKGPKFALSESDSEVDFSSPKPSTSKGKIRIKNDLAENYRRKSCKSK